jgi:hypothetical protein
MLYMAHLFAENVLGPIDSNNQGVISHCVEVMKVCFHSIPCGDYIWFSPSIYLAEDDIEKEKYSSFVPLEQRPRAGAVTWRDTEEVKSPPSGLQGKSVVDMVCAIAKHLMSNIHPIVE